MFSTTSLCACGFCVPFYAVMNYLVHPSSAPSLASDFQLPVIYPASLEATRFEIQCLIHIGKYELALRFIDYAQQNQLPQTEYHFLRGFCFQKLDNLEQAEQEYEQSLEHDNHQSHIWHNLSGLAQQQGRWSDDHFYRAKYNLLGLTREHIRPLNQRAVRHTDVAMGLSKQGQISVQDADCQRSLFINQEAQGGVWLHQGQPSTVPSNPDGAAFLLNGIHFNADTRATTGLILGLGAASGVVALLENFSQLTLTVVEVDPIVIHICLRNFPKVQHFIEQGRLKIQCADAYDYVAALNTNVDFIVADLYQGNFEPSAGLFDPHFFKRVKSQCHLLSVNLKHPESHFDRNSLIDYFSWPGMALKHVHELASSFIAGYEIYHTALFSQAISNLDTFIPFRQHEGAVFRSFQRDFQQQFQQQVQRKSAPEGSV